MTTAPWSTVPMFQLLQWKYAIKLEEKGIKVARRSVRTFACKALGLKPRTKHAEVVAHINEVLRRARADVEPND